MSNLDIWRASGFPLAVSSCVLACCKGEQGGDPLSLYAAARSSRVTLSLHAYCGGEQGAAAPVCLNCLARLLIMLAGTADRWSPPLNPPLPGVMRAHLVDAQLDGGLLLELYSRDGVGTMISADFYEGEIYAC